MAPLEHPTPAITLIGDRYRLLHRLDAHESLETWEALDERLERRVMLRFLGPSARGDADAARRFRETRRRAGAVADPALPRLLDGGEDPAYGPFIVTNPSGAMEATQAIPVVESAAHSQETIAKPDGRMGVSGSPAVTSHRSRQVRRKEQVANGPGRGGYGLIASLAVLLVVFSAGVLLIRMMTAPEPSSTQADQSIAEQPTRPLPGAQGGEPTAQPTLSARVQAPSAMTATADQPSAPAEVAQSGSPVATIQQHYALIDGRRYTEGYALMDAHLRSLNSPAEYAGWFANKVSITPISIDLVSQTRDQAVVRSVVTTTDRVEGQNVTRQVAEQFTLRMENGAWRIDQVSRL